MLLSTSEYWQDVTRAASFAPYINTEFLSLILERSAPRELELNGVRFVPSTATLLAPHWHRIAVLDIEVTERVSFSGLLLLLRASAMPSLGRLSISLNLDPAQDTERNLYQEHFPLVSPNAVPALHDLSAPFFALPSLSVPTLRHLKVLTVMASRLDSIQHSIMTVPPLMEALSRCSALESLEIGPMPEIRGRDVPTLPPERSIHLPLLQRLSIAHTCYLSAHLMHCLKFPRTTYVEVDGWDWGGVGELRDVLVPLLPVDSVLLVASAIREDNPFLFRFDLRGWERTVTRLAVRYTPVHTRPSQLIELLNTVHTLELRVEMATIPATFWGSLLITFRNVRRLCARGTNMTELLTMLALGESGMLFYCPLLSELTLGWDCADLDTLCAQGGASGPYASRPAVRVLTMVAFVLPWIKRRVQLAGKPLRSLQLEEHVGEGGRAGGIRDVSHADRKRMEAALVLLRELVEGPITLRWGIGHNSVCHTLEVEG